MVRFTQGKWEIRGNKIFVKGTYLSILQVHVRKNYQDITFKPIKDIEADANAALVVSAPDMYELLKQSLECLKGNQKPMAVLIQDIEQIISNIENA